MIRGNQHVRSGGDIIIPTEDWVPSPKYNWHIEGARAADLRDSIMAKLKTWTLHDQLGEVPSEGLLEDLNATSGKTDRNKPADLQHESCDQLCPSVEGDYRPRSR